jgi:DNA-binding CsgD family transcriptional regulator
MSIAPGTARDTNVPQTVGAAAEAALEARGDVRKLHSVLERSAVPMVVVDGERRYVEANRPARLTFRLSLQEMREHVIDDLTPADDLDALERAWIQLLDLGCIAGPYRVEGLDGSRLDVVHCALANVLPGLHLIVFAPADWPDDELGPIADDGEDIPAPLSPRELHVLALAAEGSSQLELAGQLALSPATVKTHLSNIYAKLGVRTRASAVAKAMRLGLIE